jgi:hypothetical protein
LALLLVHIHNRTDWPLASGDLIFHRTGGSVIQIQVVPAIPLRHPNHFTTIRDVAPELFPGGHQVYRVIEVDAATGTARAVINEDSKTLLRACRPATSEALRH